MDDSSSVARVGNAMRAAQRLVARLVDREKKSVSIYREQRNAITLSSMERVARKNEAPQ